MVDILIGVLVGVERVLEVWLLFLRMGLHFILDGMADWNTTGELLFVLEVLIVLLILHLNNKLLYRLDFGLVFVS